jgi:hypothetical protein
MLQVGKSRAQFPIRSFGPTQSRTETSATNLPVGKGRPACKADNFPDICEPIV